MNIIGVKKENRVPKNQLCSLLSATIQAPSPKHRPMITDIIALVEVTFLEYNPNKKAPHGAAKKIPLKISIFKREMPSNDMAIKAHRKAINTVTTFPNRIFSFCVAFFRI